MFSANKQPKTINQEDKQCNHCTKFALACQYSPYDHADVSIKLRALLCLKRHLILLVFSFLNASMLLRDKVLTLVLTHTACLSEKALLYIFSPSFLEPLCNSPQAVCQLSTFGLSNVSVNIHRLFTENLHVDILKIQ